jgi:hypothetical protein
MEDLGVKELWGKRIFNERTAYVQHLVNGIWGGYIGEGSKLFYHQKLLQKFLQDLFPIRIVKR